MQCHLVGKRVKLLCMVMKLLYLCLMILLRGIDCERPTLQPSSYHACPNDSVTFTCHDSQIHEISWSAEPYIPENLLKYAAQQAETEAGSQPIMATWTGPNNCTTHFIANLTELTHISGNMANMVTSLTFAIAGLESMSKITIRCSTARGTMDKTDSYAILYIADVPYQKNAEVSYLVQRGDTAILLLGDMFDGGGVPIDHYIIKLDNGTLLETTGPTYSLDIMYNTSLSVNISAHNCVGYSDLITLELQYEEDSMENDSSTLPLAVLISIGVFIIITAVILMLLFLCTLFQRCNKSRSKSLGSGSHIITSYTCLDVISVMDNGADMMEIHNMNDTSTSVEYTQIVMDRFLRSSQPDCTGQLSTLAYTDQHTPSQNVIGMYAEVGLNASLVLHPRPVMDDIVQYSEVVRAGSRPPSPSSEKALETDNVMKIHPLDKSINEHLVLLQLVPLQPYWHDLGRAAGVGEEVLDLINAELSDDSQRLAEVVFRWVEMRRTVRWSDVASLCKEIGFNDISEAITMAYDTGVLPVEDDVPNLERTKAPPLPPHSTDYDDGVLPIEDDIPNLEHTKAPPLFPRSIESDDVMTGVLLIEDDVPYLERIKPPPLPPHSTERDDGVLPIEDDIPTLEHTNAPPLPPRSPESDDNDDRGSPSPPLPPPFLSDSLSEEWASRMQT